MTLTDFINQLKNVIKIPSEMLARIFLKLKPLIIDKINQCLNTKITLKMGRPRSVDLNQFLDGLYFLIETGAQLKYMTKFYSISKGSFYRYLHLLEGNRILSQIHADILETYHPKEEIWMTDGSNVKSVEGSIGTGRNPTDRGRRGIKFLLITDTNLITRHVKIAPANVHDCRVLKEVVAELKPLENPIKCLADSGFVGDPARKICARKGINLISRPRRKKNGIMTHVLTTEETLLLHRRWKIEHLNGELKRYRGLRNKYTKSITTYETFLLTALLCLTCYHMSVL